MGNNMGIGKIEVQDLKWMLQSIAVINHFIKVRETGIRKTPFYKNKHYVIEYVISMCDRMAYDPCDVSYGLDCIQVKDDSAHVQNLLVVNITVDRQLFVFHHEVEEGTRKLLGDKLDALEKGAYTRKENGTFKETPNGELRETYCKVVDMLASYEWCILRSMKGGQYIYTLENKYKGFHIKPNGGVRFECYGNAKSFHCKVDGCKKVLMASTELFEAPHTSLRNAFGDKLELNYNLK